MQATAQCCDFPILFSGIYGGCMLGVRSGVSGLAFYEWDTTDLIRRIEITPKNVRLSIQTLLVS